MSTIETLLERRKRPQTLAGALGGFLKIIGARPSDAGLARCWKEIDDKSEFIAIRAKTLKIKPLAAAGALELSYRTEEIRARVNKYFGHPVIERVVIKR